jgi:hypothetical protein
MLCDICYIRLNRFVFIIFFFFIVAAGSCYFGGRTRYWEYMFILEELCELAESKGVVISPRFFRDKLIGGSFELFFYY